MNIKNKKRIRVHELAHETAAFEHFIVTCLKKETELTDYHVTKSRRCLFEFYTESGLKNVTNYPSYIEIKYSNNLDIIKDYINKEKVESYHLILIGLWDEELYTKVDIFQSKNIHVLGKRYVKKLINKYPELWWCFAGSFDETATITIDESGKIAMLNTVVLGLEDLKVQLPLKEINKISNANEFEFKRLVNEENMIPALILGNGVSIPFGSDGWVKTCDSIFDYLSPYYIKDINTVKKTIGSSSYFVSSFAKDTLPLDYYYSALWNCIYRKYDYKKMHLDTTLIRSISKIKHNHIKYPLLTYNYDCFLENDYLKEFNTNLNVVYSVIQDQRIFEPKIAHIHGYLRYRKPIAPKRVILTENDYYRSYINKKSFTVLKQKEVLKNNVCFYVGSSMTDLFQLSLIYEARKNVYSKNNDFTHKMFKCFALMCFKGVCPNDILYLMNFYLQKGIYVIFVNEFNDLPKKLESLF